MFEIWHGEKLIGWSDFEAGGDAPMGCVTGLFTPAEAFENFRASVPPEQSDVDGAFRSWYGLTLRCVAGQDVPCGGGLMLSEADFDDHIEHEVAAMGIPYLLYEELFPEVVKRYNAQFD